MFQQRYIDKITWKVSTVDTGCTEYRPLKPNNLFLFFYLKNIEICRSTKTISLLLCVDILPISRGGQYIDIDILLIFIGWVTFWYRYIINITKNIKISSIDTNRLIYWPPLVRPKKPRKQTFWSLLDLNFWFSFLKTRPSNNQESQARWLPSTPLAQHASILGKTREVTPLSLSTYGSTFHGNKVTFYMSYILALRRTAGVEQLLIKMFWKHLWNFCVYNWQKI